MKKFALICLFATMAFMANAQNETPAAGAQPEHGAKIRFEEMEHQYGTIQKGGRTASQIAGSRWNSPTTYYTIRNKVIPGNMINPARIEVGMVIWMK